MFWNNVFICLGVIAMIKFFKSIIVKLLENFFIKEFSNLSNEHSNLSIEHAKILELFSENGSFRNYIAKNIGEKGSEDKSLRGEIYEIKNTVNKLYALNESYFEQKSIIKEQDLIIKDLQKDIITLRIKIKALENNQNKSLAKRISEKNITSKNENTKSETMTKDNDMVR